MAEVAVIGAGPAGLSAALDAAQAGHSCTVFEASDAVGGMAGSFAFAGQRVDYGSHRLHSALGARQLERLKRLLGDDLQVRPRQGRIRLQQRWIGFPLRTLDLIRSLPVSFGVQVAGDVLTAPLRRGSGVAFDDSFDAAVRARLGPTVAAEFYAPYARKLYGVEPGELDAELARRRVSALGAADVARRVLRAVRPEGRQFLYPRRGYGQISEALAAAAADAGADLRLNTSVTGIDLEPHGVTLHTEAGLLGSPAATEPRAAAPVETLQAKVVLSTMPLPALAAAVKPTPPAHVTEALRRCRTRAMVLAYLALDCDRYTPFDAHYFGEADTRVARLSEPKNYRDGDDLAGRTVLCAEIPCWAGDETWQLDDEQIAQWVIDDLATSNLPAAEPVEVTVRRLPSVYPVFETATMDSRRVVNEWVASVAEQGLVSFGRQGLGVLDNLHHVLDMGESAADALSHDGAIDSARWRDSLERFKTHVVED